MSLPIYATTGERIWYYSFRVFCGLIFVFLIAPIFIIIPLSFSDGKYFTYTSDMSFSFHYYQDFLGEEFLNGEGKAWTGTILGVIFGLMIGFAYNGLSMAKLSKYILPVVIFGLIGAAIGSVWGVNGEWISPLKNSFKIALPATVLSVSLGTLAAIGLSQSHVPFKRAIMAVLISPMIVPLIVSGYGMALFYAPLGNFLSDSLGFGSSFVEYLKVILAHTVLGIPFVIITVTATLVSFDDSLTRAAANMGAGPVRTFFKVQMPLILPGMISGGLFAFITSFDEVVVIILVGSTKVQTLPWQMFTGLREQISLTILAVATFLVLISIMLLVWLEIMRRRNEKLRGIENY